MTNQEAPHMLQAQGIEDIEKSKLVWGPEIDVDPVYRYTASTIMGYLNEDVPGGEKKWRLPRVDELKAKFEETGSTPDGFRSGEYFSNDADEKNYRTFDMKTGQIILKDDAGFNGAGPGPHPKCYVRFVQSEEIKNSEKSEKFVIKDNKVIDENGREHELTTDLLKVENLVVIRKIEPFNVGSNSGGGSGVVIEYDDWSMGTMRQQKDSEGVYRFLNYYWPEGPRQIRTRKQVLKYEISNSRDTADLTENWIKLQKLGLVE